MNSSKVSVAPLNFVKVDLKARNGLVVRVSAMIDTGASSSAVSREMVEILDLVDGIKDKSQEVVTGNGTTKMDVLEVNLTIPDSDGNEAKFIMWPVMVTDGLGFQAVIGMDLLRNFNMRFESGRLVYLEALDPLEKLEVLVKSTPFFQG